MKNGSGLDNFGAKKNIVPIVINEQKKVRNPMVTKNFRVDKMDGASEVTGRLSV